MPVTFSLCAGSRYGVAIGFVLEDNGKVGVFFIINTQTCFCLSSITLRDCRQHSSICAMLIN